jgi:lysophospholipase L1-like esterase
MRASGLRDAVGVLLASVLLLSALEVGLRVAWALRNALAPVVLLPYTAAQDWGPKPPWLDGLRILDPDPVLLWRGRAGVRRTYLDVYGPVHREADRVALLQRFWPRVPAALRGRPTWSVAMGSHGFREREFAREKAPGTLRIACLGDSWTFGANVDQEAAYPQRLGALLRERLPDIRSEVLNLGVMGYSSRQGLELLRRRILDLAPDVVLIGFAMNDSVVDGWHDADAVGTDTRRERTLLDHLETLRFARYLVKRARHEPWTIGDHLAEVARAAGSEDELWTGRQAVEFADEAALERLARVPPSAYEQNLREMVRLVQERGADVVLLYNELWDTPYRRAVERVARDAAVPWVDSFSLLAVERARREAALAARLALAPAGAAASQVILRVHQGPHRVPDALYVAGDHPALGDATPNRVALRDDGRGGDERAGDGVWSLAVALDPVERIFYVYTNSGRPGRWEGLDVPDLRHLAHPVPGYRPIETFGALTLQADGWHTDADGYALIAEAVRAALPAPVPR